MRHLRRWTLIAALGLSTASMGCKEDPMARARTAVATERADEAESALKEVLANNPKDFEARRLMADVHRFRGDFEKAESTLKELWEEKGFGDESKELAPEERAHRDLLENQFVDLYAAWSEEIDPASDPDKFVQVVRSGLEWNEKSAQMNRKLVDFYFARGEELEKKGEKLAAAQAYEEVAQLRALKQRRADAATKAIELRKEGFMDMARKHFEEQVKSKLIEAEQWDEENKRITMAVEADVDRRLRQNRDEDLAEARKVAGPAIKAAIAQMVQMVANVEAPVAAAAGVKITSGDESLRRGKYSVSIAMTVEDVLEGAFKAHEKARQAAEAAENEAEDAAEKPAEGDAPADGQTNGGTGGTNGATNAGAEGAE